MKIKNAYLLSEVLLDHNEHYPSDHREALLEGLREICATCGETLDSRFDQGSGQEARRELESTSRLIQRHLVEGELTEGFLVAFEGFHKAFMGSAEPAS